MSDWTDGYVADIGYTHGYYPELNPMRARLAFLNAGLVPPEVGTACELGYGQGLSANLHAAAGGLRWYGTDFNPSQAAFAQELAGAAGSGAQLFDEGFAQFCARSDLPDFDYIGLHGIWSWVSDENRAVIVDFVNRKLKVGGVLYISYNTHPGWAAMVPMRDLLTGHAEVMGASGAGTLGRVDAALSFADQLFAANPAFAKAHPQVVERIKRIQGQNRHYVAHEYFNRDWQPMSFARMAQWLQPAKLQWACSAHGLDSLDAINLSAEQQTLLAGIPDPMFRQTVRDFCVNQSFRKDFWVKGARKLSPLDQGEQLGNQRVLLAMPRDEVKLTVAGSLGEATLQEGVYAPLLDQLADHRPKSLAQLEQALKSLPEGQGIGYPQLLQAVVLLCANGTLLQAQDDPQIARARKVTDRLNAHLLQKARSSSDLGYLASPVSGGGVGVPRFQQLFLLARQADHKKPADWAQFVWKLLARQGQHLLRDGKPLASAEENLAALGAQAEVFAQKTLPILKALQIA